MTGGGDEAVAMLREWKGSAGHACASLLCRPHLRARVYDVDLVQRDHVHHLLALLQLALGALHELGGRPCRTPPPTQKN